MKKGTPYLGMQYESEDGELCEVYAVGGGHVGCFSLRKGEGIQDRTYTLDDFNRFFTLTDRYSELFTDTVSNFLKDQHESEQR